MKPYEELFLENFHIKTYEDIYAEDPNIYRMIDITVEHYGHEPTTYDCRKHGVKDDQFTILSSETVIALRKLENPVGRFGTTFMCDQCMRSVSEMLLNGTISNMYYGIYFDIEDGIEDIMRNILHTKKEVKAWEFLSKMEDGIPQTVPENAWSQFLCGHCISVMLENFALRQYEHNITFPFEEELLHHAEFSADTAKSCCRPPCLYIEDWERKDGKLEVHTSKDIHAYPESITTEEKKFLKEMGFVFKKDKDKDEYILL